VKEERQEKNEPNNSSRSHVLQNPTLSSAKNLFDVAWFWVTLLIICRNAKGKTGAPSKS